MTSQNKPRKIISCPIHTRKKNFFYFNYKVDILIKPKVKYLGIIIDKRLTWSPHLKSKRKLLNYCLHILLPTLKSKLSINSKLTIYKSFLRPIWTYDSQIWGSAKLSQLQTIQEFQFISLRLIKPAPWYVTNNTLHNDLKIQTVEQLTKQ